MRTGALAESSLKVYKRHWEQWTEWCSVMNYSEWLAELDIRSSTTQLGAYAVFLWRFGMNRANRGNNYSTICKKLCAVRWYHRYHLGYDPGVTAQHALLLQGIRRFSDPTVKQQPLTPALLRRIHTLCDFQLASHSLLWGGLLLGYFFLFRRSEYLFVGKRFKKYIIRLKDITFHDKRGNVVPRNRADMVRIVLNGSKNNQYGREEARFQHATLDKILCPVLAARWIHKGAKFYNTAPSDPAMQTNEGGITSKMVACVIKAAAQAEGLDPSRFSTHSVRIGGATTLLNAGADRLVIKLLGRWLSSCFEQYPVLTAEGTKDISKLMC